MGDTVDLNGYIEIPMKKKKFLKKLYLNKWLEIGDSYIVVENDEKNEVLRLIFLGGPIDYANKPDQVESDLWDLQFFNPGATAEVTLIWTENRGCIVRYYLNHDKLEKEECFESQKYRLLPIPGVENAVRWTDPYELDASDFRLLRKVFALSFDKLGPDEKTRLEHVKANLEGILKQHFRLSIVKVDLMGKDAGDFLDFTK